MNDATIWLIGLIAFMHIGLAVAASLVLIKDQNISIATKWVHGLLAWLVPVLGCLFSIYSFLGTSDVKDIVLVKYTNDHIYGDNDFDGDD